METEKLSIQELVDKTLLDLTKRSFSGRNPELGKMFKCQVCKMRHRGQQCEIKYAASTEDTDRYERRSSATLASRATRKAAKKLIRDIECGNHESSVAAGAETNE